MWPSRAELRAWGWAAALALATPALAASPHVEAARAAEAAGDAAGALAAWQRAVEAAPEDYEAQVSVGRLQLKVNRLDAAIQTLEAVVRNAPSTPRARYFLAFALRKSGRLPEAAERYRQAIEGAPDDPDPRFGLAETLKAQGDGAGALEAYRAYVRLERRPEEAKWVARANEEIARLSATEVVEPEGALSPGAESVAAAPPPAPAAPPSADPEAVFTAGRYREAADLYLAQVERSPDTVSLRYRAAVASLAAGDYRSAEQQAVNVARLDPDNPDATGLALAARARRAAAPPPGRADAELALREGRNRTAASLAGTLLLAAPGSPDAPAMARVRATALLRLGRAAEALESYRRAGGLADVPGDLWLSVGDAYAAAGDAPAARRAWRLAADLLGAESAVGRRARDRLTPTPLRLGEPP